MREFFVLHRVVGRTRRNVNFQSILAGCVTFLQHHREEEQEDTKIDVLKRF